MATSPDVQLVSPHDVGGHILINGDKINLYIQHRRSHYKTNDFIVKIDAWAGCREARREIELWEDLDEEDRKHFVPILCGSINQRWVCQEYLQITHPNRLYDEVRRIEIWTAIIKPLTDKYLLYDVTSEWNWGMVDGVPMIYDYGQ